MRKLHGKRNDQIVRDLFGQNLSAEEVYAHGAAKEALYRKLMRPHVEEYLVPGVVPFLERHNDRPLAVASNAEPANVNFLLDEAKLRRFFRAVVNGHEVTHPKPHPEIYRKVAELLCVSPGECIVFEDSAAGMEAARQAGARVVAVQTTDAPLPPGDFAIRDFNDTGLETWLRRQDS
ncbi:MAG: HAD-IA family hydrolase [Candidatus Solibacter usitatus]|nr:HAD-IA family hydrolase [Candidatus Solibacter usitatus]